MARGLGMNVLISERKPTTSFGTPPGRTSFYDTLAKSTVIVLALPLTANTTSYISLAELSLMRPDALLINVSRGGIVVEADLVAAIKQKIIAGAASDVFSTEPAGRDNVLVGAASEWREQVKKVEAGKPVEPFLDGRLILTPHLACKYLLSLQPFWA
jgi:lactate dehydrogenase-like 2-hydroxyacid dehydrogenase